METFLGLDFGMLILSRGGVLEKDVDVGLVGGNSRIGWKVTYSSSLPWQGMLVVFGGVGSMEKVAAMLIMVGFLRIRHRWQQDTFAPLAICFGLNGGDGNIVLSLALWTRASVWILAKRMGAVDVVITKVGSGIFSPNPDWDPCSHNG
ncbi:hypothetical protein M0R45_019280 [Rubus argutus]|uniref:Uncharacterized protein n=1 Tax=Rubus argutus TaxID=59490 RepID=A0AAW1X6B7_RUBAR